MHWLTRLRHGEKPDPTASQAQGLRKHFLGQWAFLSEHFLIGGGMLMTSLLSLLANAMIGRFLGPDQFGRYSLAFYIIVTLVQLSWAIDDALIKHMGAEPQHTQELLYAALLLKLALHGGILLAGAVLAGPVTHLLQKPNFTLLYILALAGGGVTGLFQMLLAYYRARQEFRAYVAWSIGLNAVLLGGTYLINRFGLATATANLVWLDGLTAAAVAVWWVVRGRRFALANVTCHIRQLLRFSAWLGIANLAATVQLRLDFFVLSGVRDYRELGMYSAAMRVATIVEMFTRLTTLVLFPKAMAVRTTEAARHLFKEAAVIVILAFAAGLAMIGLASPLLRLFFGPAFSGAVLPTQLLCGANLALLGYTVMGFVFYLANKPWLLAALEVFKLVAAAVLTSTLVPRLGIQGAALARLSTNVLGLIFVAVCAKKLLASTVWNNLKQQDQSSSNTGERT